MKERVLRCRYLLQYSSHQVFQGAVLRSQDFPSYFRSAAQQRTIAADDALGSPITSELRQVYLEPLGHHFAARCADLCRRQSRRRRLS